MERMRDLLRGSLGGSLKALPPLDRLAAAWPVVCGTGMAAHGEIAGLDDGVVRIAVSDEVWLGQMLSMRSILERDLARIAAVPLTGIHFDLKK
jgi:hypothetical protein